MQDPKQSEKTTWTSIVSFWTLFFDSSSRAQQVCKLASINNWLALFLTTALFYERCASSCQKVSHRSLVKQCHVTCACQRESTNIKGQTTLWFACPICSNISTSVKKAYQNQFVHPSEAFELLRNIAELGYPRRNVSEMIQKCQAEAKSVDSAGKHRVARARQCVSKSTR